MSFTQTRSTDCGLYAIAYAVDLAAGNNPSDINYDQGAMLSHISQCIFKKQNINFSTTSTMPR